MNFNTKQNILILSPHSDDAELGCGGTISKFLDEGHQILWVVFSTAEESLPIGFSKDALKQEFINVANFLGLQKNNYEILGHKVRKLQEVRQDILEKLVLLNKSFRSDIVIGPSLKDFHQDHNVVASEMIRAFKTSSSILCYELPWNHIEFETQLFVKLSKKNIDKKIKMMELYKTQYVAKRHYFTSNFSESLATVRGAQINYKYAEAFEVVRWQL